MTVRLLPYLPVPRVSCLRFHLVGIGGGAVGDDATRTLDAVSETPGVALAAAAPRLVSDLGTLNVFISYSRDDISFADQLDATLQIGGFATTVDRHGIDGGEHWKTRLGTLIRDADTVVFVLTPASARSPICDW